MSAVSILLVAAILASGLALVYVAWLWINKIEASNRRRDKDIEELKILTQDPVTSTVITRPAQQVVADGVGGGTMLALIAVIVLIGSAVYFVVKSSSNEGATAPRKKSAVTHVADQLLNDPTGTQSTMATDCSVCKVEVVDRPYYGNEGGVIGWFGVKCSGADDRCPVSCKVWCPDDIDPPSNACSCREK